MTDVKVYNISCTGICVTNIIMSRKPIVGYIHNLSPVKMGRKVEYCDFELQLQDERVNAICFSKAKRNLLEKNATNLSPIKITNFLEGEPHGEASTSRRQIKINDMTKIQELSANEYDFQYQESPASKKLNLKTILSCVEPMQMVGTVEGKVTKEGTLRTVGKNSLKMMKSVINDATEMMTLLLWQGDIKKVETGKVYRISNVRVRNQDGGKILSSTPTSTFVVIKDDTLDKLDEKNAKSMLDELDDFYRIDINSIDSVEAVDKFLSCVHCSKKLQSCTKGKIVKCDRCSHRMRIADCAASISIRIRVSFDENESVSLTLFNDVIETVVPNATDLDDDALSEKLLDLKKMTIIHDRFNVVKQINIL